MCLLAGCTLVLAGRTGLPKEQRRLSLETMLQLFVSVFFAFAPNVRNATMDPERSWRPDLRHGAALTAAKGHQQT